MTDDVKELTFNNNFYNDDGTTYGSYSGDVVIDFTTEKLLSGYISADVDGHGGSSSVAGTAGDGLELSVNENGHYELYGRPNGLTSSESVSFTGDTPSSIDSASFTDYISRFETASGDTTNTTADQRPITVTNTTTTPSLTFNETTSGFKSSTQPMLTGRVSDPSGILNVEIYNGDTDLGTATVNSTYGSWTFTGNLGSGDYADLTAVATANSGGSTSASAPYELVTGVKGEPYGALEYDATSDKNFNYTEYSRTGKVLVTAFENGKDAHTITTSNNGQVIYSATNDTITVNGSAETFTFLQHFKHDEVTNFQVGGAQHDVVDLSNTHIRTLAQVLADTTMSHGSATIQVDARDSITLDGVTKAELKAHRSDFVFA